MKKGLDTVRIWISKSNVSVEFVGYTGRMRFSLYNGSDLYVVIQNIDFKYIELYHHKVLKAEADWTDEKQRNEFNRFFCNYFDL